MPLSEKLLLQALNATTAKVIRKKWVYNRFVAECFAADWHLAARTRHANIYIGTELIYGHDKDIDLMRRILAFKAADPLKIGPFLVTKVSKDKEGYPLTLTIKAVDGAPLSDDKLNLATEVFGKRGAEGMRAGKEKIRQLVDAVRTAQEESPQESERTGRERGM
jgi:hypothetical protein